jgi:hypothetical protein
MTPSRVGVYVNNQLVRVEQLPPSVYQLDHLPLPVGAGDTRRRPRCVRRRAAVRLVVYISGSSRAAYSGSRPAGAERSSDFLPAEMRPHGDGPHRIRLTDSVWSVDSSKRDRASPAAAGHRRARTVRRRRGHRRVQSQRDHWRLRVCRLRVPATVRRRAGGEELLVRCDALVEIRAGHPRAIRPRSAPRPRRLSLGATWQSLQCTRRTDGQAWRRDGLLSVNAMQPALTATTLRRPWYWVLRERRHLARLA